MSELLNIWREVGSYNRFGETKNSFFFALILAIGSIAVGARPPHFLFDLLYGGNQAVFSSAIFLAAIVCLLSFIPIIAFPSNLLLSGFGGTPPTTLNRYYFYHIAHYESSESWLRALALDLNQQEIARANELAHQVWIISRIARRKFMLLRLAMIILFGGWAFAWVAVGVHYLGARAAS